MKARGRPRHGDDLQVKGKVFPVEVFSVARQEEAGALVEPLAAGQGAEGAAQGAGHDHTAHSTAAPLPAAPPRQLKPIIGAERMCAQVNFTRHIAD